MRRLLATGLMALLALPLPLRASQNEGRPAPEVGAFVRGLAPGTHVKLVLTSGARLSGLLIAVDRDVVAVRPKTRIPEPLRRVPIDQIADADLPRARATGKTIAAAAAVGAGAALGFLSLLVALYGGD